MYDYSVLQTRTPVERMCFDFMVDQNQFLADKLFDPKMVDINVKKVPQFDGSKLRTPNTQSKTDALAQLIDEQAFYRNIDLAEHKLGKNINPHAIANSDNPSLIDETRAAKIVTLGLLMKREAIAATLATTAANYASSLTSALAAGDRWDDNGDPEAQKIAIDNALVLTCGRKANAVAMSGTTYRKLKTNPNFRDRVKYTQSGPVTIDAIKAFFDVDYVFISDNVQNTANEGAADAISSFWGTNVIFFVYQPSVAMDHVGYGAMWMRTSPFWNKSYDLVDRNGPDGSMRRVEVGTEYSVNIGIVDNQASGKFAAGYLLRTAVS